MSEYTRTEYERRFVVTGPWRPLGDVVKKRIEDLYIRNTALRLRVQLDDSGRRLVKLTKKTPGTEPYTHQLSQIILGYDEFKLFDAMPGDRLAKVRYYVSMRTEPLRIVAVDVFEGELSGLVLCEIEAESPGALLSLRPPDYATREVTGDPFFTGGVLCRVPRAELLSRLHA